MSEEVEDDGWKGWANDIGILFYNKKALKIAGSNNDEDLVGYADGGITEDNIISCEYVNVKQGRVINIV